MKFGRPDYDAAIQPWPAHRGHLVRDAHGALCEVKGTHDRSTDAALLEGTIAPLIPADEPVFLIRAQDVAGPEAVRQYCGLAAEAGVDPEVIKGVLAQVEAMERWQADHGAKPAELAAAVPAWPVVSRTDDPGRAT